MVCTSSEVPAYRTPLLSLSRLARTTPDGRWVPAAKVARTLAPSRVMERPVSRPSRLASHERSSSVVTLLVVGVRLWLISCPSFVWGPVLLGPARRSRDLPRPGKRVPVLDAVQSTHTPVPCAA